MKKIPLGIALIIFPVVLFAGCTLQSATNTSTTNVNTTAQSTTTLSFHKQSDGTIEVVSEASGLALSLPESLRLTASTGDDASTVLLSRQNLHSGATEKRETPNRSNTQSHDTVILRLFENTQQLTPVDYSGFRLWHATTLPSQTLVDVQAGTIGYAVIETKEMDGIGSTGLYYYFVGKDGILMAGTDDLTDAEMQTLLGDIKDEGVGILRSMLEYQPTDNAFSISVPTAWTTTTASQTGSDYAAGVNTWHFSTQLPADEHGKVLAYIFSITKHGVATGSDCHAWVTAARAKAKQEMLKSGGVNVQDAEDFVKARFDPVIDVHSGNILCQLPDLNEGDYAAAHYVVTSGSAAYGITFPVGDSPNTVILDPLPNYILATQMERSLDFTQSRP